MRIVVTMVGVGTSYRARTASKGRPCTAVQRPSRGVVVVPVSLLPQPHAGIHAREKAHEFVVVTPDSSGAGCESRTLLRGLWKAADPVACGSRWTVAAMGPCCWRSNSPLEAQCF
uniref:Predicted protein n=1 Tax=Hordeum vulgare subsp. vulgare TaxID=112509 RepID=F2CXN4_HORVV|nr:predicted protein [Hordeum vulgare subsp. vulgare]